MSEQHKARGSAPASSEAESASLRATGPWPRGTSPRDSEPQQHSASRPPPVPPRPARKPGAPASAPQAAPPPVPARPDANAPDVPPSFEQVEEVQAEDDIEDAPDGLKLVTISPATLSFPDLDTARELARQRDPYLGCTIDGRYKVEEVLGEGGMGVVYQCTHKIIGKKVAMKVLRSDLARDREVTERFLNEAKAASAIGNPHIIDISDFGELPDGSTYFVMEFLHGSPLSMQIEGGKPLPIGRLLHIARQLAEGLSAAHKAQIVHRDLKPDNIFLINRSHEKDFVKILDFGIAKVSTTAEGRITRAGAVFGTPHYMSPEQAAGTPIDHRGDIYSFGVILYELASGRVPFDADNFMGILTQHMYKAPVPIRALLPQPQEVPAGLEAIVLKCLSKRPEHRYQTMEEVSADLDKLRLGSVPDAVPEMMARSGGFNVPADYFNRGGMPAPVPASPVGTSGRRSRGPMVAGILVAAAAVATVVGLVAGGSKDAAEKTANTAEVGQTTPETKPPPAQPTPSAAPADDLAVTRQVALAVEPIDAHAFRGDQDLGTSPVMIEIEEGKAVKIEIRRDGYKSRTIKLDGTTPKASVKLERLAVMGRPLPSPRVRPQSPAPGNAKGKPKSNLGGGEIVNPWE